MSGGALVDISSMIGLGGVLVIARLYCDVPVVVCG